MLDPLRVLIVEDSVDDAFLITKELSREFRIISERVASSSTMQASLMAHTWDLIISDYSMPGFGGDAALKLYLDTGLDIPFIMVSGEMGEALAVKMVKSGAHNYVMKSQLDRLVPAVHQELRLAEERRVRKQAEAATVYIASMVEFCDDAIIGTTLDGTVVSWNAGAERLFGYTAAEMVGHSGSLLVPSFRPEDMTAILRGISERGHVEPFETERLRKDGTPVEVLLTISPVRDAKQRVIGASMVVHDITRRKLEENDRLALIQELTAALAHMSNANIQPPAKR